MHRRSNVLAIVLGLSVMAAATGACGPPTPANNPDGLPDPQPSASSDTPPDGTGTATPAPAPEHHAHQALTASTPLTTSSMLAEVKAIGIDMKKISKLEDIELGQKKKLMPLFQKALGYKDCTGCHVEGDFKKETKNIRMARGMWNHYIKELRDEKGGALFCDSCHSGNEHVLARGDKDALNKFMTEQYEGKITRADGEEHSCSTCHTDTFETKIFEKLWKVKG